MSHCIFGNIFIGAIVKKEDFFIKTESLTWRCENGHIRKNIDMVLCMIDGCKYLPFPTLKPTKAFAKWVRENYSTNDIEDIYEHLLLMTSTNDKLGIFCIDNLRSCDLFSLEKRKNSIIGYKISHICSKDDPTDNQIIAISNDYLQLKIKQVEELLEKLNIKSAVQIFHNMEII